jgi:hypothetical protein
MIDLKKLAAASLAASSPKGSKKKCTATATVADGVLTITVPLVGSAPNSSGRSIPVGSFAGLSVEGSPGFRSEADGDLIESSSLIVHVHGGVSVYSRDAGVRAALGLEAGQ